MPLLLLKALPRLPQHLSLFLLSHLSLLLPQQSPLLRLLLLPLLLQLNHLKSFLVLPLHLQPFSVQLCSMLLSRPSCLL